LLEKVAQSLGQSLMFVLELFIESSVVNLGSTSRYNTTLNSVYSLLEYPVE